MKTVIRSVVKNQWVRYIFFGGCTTMVNLGSYWVLRTLIGLDVTKANFFAIVLAILFAYVVNKIFVFESKTKTASDTVYEMAQFVGMRLLTMFLEIYGVVMLTCVWRIQDMVGKLVIQVLVLILNYIFSKIFVFRNRENTKTEHESARYRNRKWSILLGFLVPAGTMLIAYIVNGVYPFGDHGVLIIDSLHQYLPFFTDFHEKLVKNQSLLYSFGGGLGYNMWAAFAYYLASPLNLLISFVSMDHVMDFMAYLILIKISLCGGLFAWYLSGKNNGKDLFPVPFACMYALSSFMIGYYFNLMWLDSIMVVPVLMYGIERIVAGKKGKAFGVALFYGLFCNYYIGYMLCLFSCLYFLVLWGAAKKFHFWKFIKSGLKFTWYALLAGGMAAVVLMPAYCNLKLTESADSSFPSKIKIYVSELTQFTGHFAFVEPINIYDNQSGVNIYCGVIILILLVLYCLDRKIRIAERTSKLGLVILLAASMNINVLNYIWHGFHIQNGLPNRFAFLYIALILTMGFEALRHAGELSVGRKVIAWIIPIALVAYCMVQEYGEREWYVYMITLLLLVLYGIMIFAQGSKGFILRYMKQGLAFVMTLEMVATGIFGICMNGTVGRSSYINDQKAYQTMISRQGAEGFFRSEIDSQRMRNENMFMGANGLVLFSSTMPEATVNLCRSIGMEARTNKNGYIGVTKLFNDVFGIRYVLSKYGNEELNQMERIDYADPLTLYENSDALSLGFMVSSDIKQWDIDAGTAMDVQRMFATLATELPFSYTLRESYSLEEGPVYIIRLHPGEQTYLEMTENVKSITVKTPQGEKTYNNYNDNLFNLGRVYTEGEDSKANISITYKEGKGEPVPVRVYTCTDEEYQEIYDILSRNQMENVEVQGDHLSGTIRVDKEGTLLLTVPYDKGWTILVDDEKTEAYRVGEALTGIDLTEGEHRITMEYLPQGFYEGTLISGICVVLFLVSCLIEEQIFRKKRKIS